MYVTVHDRLARNLPSVDPDVESANGAILSALKPDAVVGFDFVERAPGEWMITKVVPRGGSPTGAAETAPAHQGH